jgi:carbonic anhydrase
MISIEDTIRGDVALIRQSPLVGKDVQVVGLKYDTFTGLLSEVHRE